MSAVDVRRGKAKPRTQADVGGHHNILKLQLLLTFYGHLCLPTSAYAGRTKTRHRMARSIRSSTLETRSARLRRPVAIKPTFVRVAKGLGLGYRRNKSGGVWVMRVADGKRGSWVRTRHRQG